jgi:hypothetical protein
VESRKHFEDPAQKTKHCLRRNGTERAWFLNREEAEHFAESPTNPAYHGDIAHECAKCGFYHLSKPSWLRSVWVYWSGQEIAQAQGYSTLPPSVVQKVRAKATALH